MVDLKEETGGKLKNVCGKIIKEGVEFKNISPSLYEKLKSNSNKPSLVMVEQRRFFYERKTKYGKHTSTEHLHTLLTDTCRKDYEIKLENDILVEVSKGSEYKLIANGGSSLKINTTTFTQTGKVW